MRHLGRTALVLLSLLFATAAVAQQVPNCTIPAPDFSMAISPASQSVPGHESARNAVIENQRQGRYAVCIR
jgi:hypothetical protein